MGFLSDLGNGLKDGLGYIGDGLGAVVGGVLDPVLGTEEKARAAQQQFEAQQEAQKRNQAEIEAARGRLAGNDQMARDYVGQGYQQSRNDMAPLQELQQFTGGATRAIGTGKVNPYDVTGQQYGLQGQLAQGDQLYQQAGQAAKMENDPGYQFRLQQGEEAINRSAAARGGRLGGATLKALAGYNSGMAAQEYGAANDRQMSRNAQQAGILGQQYGAYGNVDQMRQGALMNQAGRTDAAGQQQIQNNFQGQLASQQNQMGLAQMGYGAQSQLAGMANDYGQNMANLYGQTTQNDINLTKAGMGLNDKGADSVGMVSQQEGNNKSATGGAALTALAAYFSDRRLKTNIDNGADAADELLKALKPHTFEYINKALGEGRLLGIMAQDLEGSAAGAELVVDVDGFKAIDTTKSVMALMGIVARLAARIEALENGNG
jgi:hypothetical protein